MLASALALGAMTTFALAELPAELTNAQMDKVTGGQGNPHSPNPTSDTGNPHGLNNGGQSGGCGSNPTCSSSTGNPH
jgi:hypothetical protein